MGLLLMLRPPQPHPKSLRRATRAQRREHRRTDVEEWETAQRKGRLLEIDVETLLPLVNSAGGTRLPVLGQLAPWSDAVLDHHDAPRLEADLDRLAAVAGDDAQRALVAAMRKLLTAWRAEPDLLLHWYGD
ncbi:hypothetical protein Sru01_69160 [Sphaerisporangium rufum]|uniref:Uncharacterized protein n=1 Tax=Sphaerisporangium rufum TaxID=1381558 RepID=A0A919R9L3_9ACTN|nr:hypothetical protein [Sphaerisporangium rufum]GII81934.1 hypothetical protein Sru01_69160 [Sphaerisporangium rufum]